VTEAMMAFFYTDEEMVSAFLADTEFDTMEELWEEHGFELMSLEELTWFGFAHEDIRHLVALEIGEVSNVIQFAEGVYLLFILDDIYILPDDEIEDMFMEIYMGDHRFAAFRTELERWQADMRSEITVNQRAIDSIDLDALFE